MPSSVFPSRYTADNSEDIVVFIIGMRINKRLSIHRWLPVFLAMSGMIKELYTHKRELGFQSAENHFGLRTTAMIQYWRSLDDLLAYSKNENHLKAWKKFNRITANNDAVGIYHETYILSKGQYESVYVNMPQYGLGKATKHIPITIDKQTAKKRLSR
ncbi:DUF4188 domain-containing protein [Sporosarcina gallistercoris]|uniref:DUF4188 domain-containing protein n=1 Tax=Sporosarcina gallistercoris TaxID=2762245 RepID=A0ABR8PLN0_9BACL|nr:DUF4188 domain-containing protein [Sporosarcina gallistercoris]MBD7909092.1 DUF4188 domain-containing protein [Sporosarcina gallistercoris]